MPRLKLTIAYVGTHYQGWQVQAWKNRPNPPTVQGEIERALADVVGRPVHVQGAGRTDSGVHADAQIAHCDVPEEKTRLDWVLALNTRLPHDIRVTDFAYVPDDFNALLKLPGVGRKSANLIMGDVFEKPAIVTDTHCIRLVNRIGLVEGIKDPKRVEMALWKLIPPEEGSDFCHRLVYHGREVCTARTKPYCDKCCLQDICAKAGVE